MRYQNYIVAMAASLSLLIGARGISQDTKKAPTKKQTIKAVEGLQFSPVRFSAKKGEKIELKFENHDPNDQPHNIVLIKPGGLKEIQVASMAVGPDAAEKGFVPESDLIISQSKLLTADQSEVITIEAPKEKGIYPYVCTFPGHAMVMYGALYVDTKYPDDVAFDPNVPEIARAAELEKIKAKMDVARPTMTRLFMPDAGPAAIAVALQDDLNFCWDAGNCRLRYVWSGGYVDATKMWNSNGNALGKILGIKFWQSGPGEKTFGLQFGDSPAESVDFQGYRIVNDVPVFKYKVGDVAVQEYIEAAGAGKLSWRFKIENPTGDVKVLAPQAGSAEIASTVGKRDGDHWVIPQKEGSEFTLTITKK